MKIPTKNQNFLKIHFKKSIIIQVKILFYYYPSTHRISANIIKIHSKQLPSKNSSQNFIYKK